MTLDDKGQLIEQILRLELEVYRALHPIVPEAWLQTDLTMPQLRVLLLLFTDGPARMSSLANNMGITLATTTGVVDRLVERRLVAREGLPDDRRVVICRLSEEGFALVSRLWELGQARVRRLLEAMTGEQLETVSRAMQTILSVATKAKPATRTLDTSER